MRTFLMVQRTGDLHSGICSTNVIPACFWPGSSDLRHWMPASAGKTSLFQTAVCERRSPVSLINYKKEKWSAKNAKDAKSVKPIIKLLFYSRSLRFLRKKTLACICVGPCSGKRTYIEPCENTFALAKFQASSPNARLITSGSAIEPCCSKASWKALSSKPGFCC